MVNTKGEKMEDILMSQKEAERYRILIALQGKQLNLHKASELLELSYRHTSRIFSQFEKEGLKALISKKRGRKSNRAISQELEDEIIIIIRQRYSGYGPTLAAEKLWENHTIKISNEKVRQLLIKQEIPYKKKYRKS